MRTLITRLTQLYHTLGHSQMERLSCLFFLALIICLPFQRRLQFLGAHSFVTGSFTEYTSYFLYATDLLVLALGILYIIAVRRGTASRPPKTLSIIAVFFLLATTLSAITAPSPLLALYGTLRWALLLTLSASTAYYIVRHFRLEFVALALVISASLQALVASMQFALQRSIGLGFLLGESQLAVTMTNVAKVVVDGDRYLRPYGTFPHPNVLAAFIALGLLSVIYLLGTHAFYARARHRLLLFVLAGLLLWCMLITLSRGALLFVCLWGVLLFGFVLFHVKRNKSLFHVKQPWRDLLPWLTGVTVALGAMIVALQKFLLARATAGNTESDVSASARSSLVAFSQKIIDQGQPLGAGLNNFVIALHQLAPNLHSWEYQPVHNIYLLLLSEVGLIGTAFLIAIIIYSIFCLHRARTNITNTTYIAAMLGFLLCVGLLDHYLLTLQQGQLMLSLVLGLSLGASVSRETETKVAQSGQ